MLDERLQTHQEHVQNVLQENILKATKMLEDLGAFKHGNGIKRLKYTVIAKSSLNENINDLQLWQKMFDPSWYLLCRIAVQQIDSR